MKKLLFFGGMILLLTRCSQDPLVTNNNSGQLQSITSYGGDSAQAGFQYQKYNFQYDASNRVSLITFHSNNVTVQSDHTVSFLYTGTDTNPYRMMDSILIKDPAGALTGIHIQKTYFFFDGSGNKIKDSSELYFRNHTPPYDISNFQTPQYHQVYKYTYQPTRILITTKYPSGAFYTDDTCHINSSNQVIKTGAWVNGGYRTLDIVHGDDPNPMGVLNISKALFNRWSFMGVNFHPQNYDMLHTTKLPKTCNGIWNDVSNPQTLKLNLYCDKNLAGKVNKIVAAKRRYYYPSGTLFDFYYTNYTFDYYP